MGKNFHMIDESFTCTICGKKVEKLGYTARDHCPYCLHSIHVDNNPGDRECNCKGVLVPKGIVKYRNTYKIAYQCLKCGMSKVNIVADDDNNDLIIELSANALGQIR